MIAIPERHHLCLRCGAMKPRSDFSTRRGGVEPSARCRTCSKQSCREYQRLKTEEANFIRQKSLETHDHAYAIKLASAERGREVSKAEFLAIIRGEVKESGGRWPKDYVRVGWRHRKASTPPT